MAAEWGLIALFLWLVGTAVRCREFITMARHHDDVPAASIAPMLTLYLVMFLVVEFSLGIGFFESYIANVCFWLFSGIVLAGNGSTSSTPVRHLAGTASRNPL